jgi:hypothetical protein
MKPQQVLPNQVKNTITRSTQDTRLYGHGLFIARSLWLVLVVLILAFFVVSIPVYFTQLQTLCQTASCANGQLTQNTTQALLSYNLSMSNYALFSVVITIVSALVWFIVAALLIWHKSNDWMVLLIALMLVMQGVYGAQGTYSTNTVAGSSSVLQFPAQLVQFLAFTCLAFVLCLFPDGHFVPRWTSWLLIVFMLFSVSHNFLFDWPFNTNAWASLLDNVLFVGCIIGFIIAQIYRYRQVSSSVQRQQTKWVVFGVTAFLVGNIAFGIPLIIIPSLAQSNSLYSLVLIPITTILFLFIPLSIGIATLRYRLYDIDVLINRTLVYGSLTVLLVLIYFGSVIGLEALLHNFTQSSDLAIVGSTLAITALFQPLRKSIQKLIDRRFYRNKYDAARTLANFSTTLRGEVDLLQLQEHLVEVINETMQPTHVSLWLRSPEKKKGVTL